MTARFMPFTGRPIITKPSHSILLMLLVIRSTSIPAHGTPTLISPEKIPKKKSSSLTRRSPTSPFIRKRNTTNATLKPGRVPTLKFQEMDRDIIIIGGGPSGLSTALHLQRIAPHLASRILILEKEHYPRFKLCAGGLTIDAEILLERLGLDVSEVPHVTADNVHFDFAGKGLNIHMRGRHTLRVIRRDEFDNWLAKKAESRGIEIREGVTVKNIIPNQDGVTIETDQGIFHAQVIVGADGSNGITRRMIFPNAPLYTARVLEVITPEYNVIARGTKPDEPISIFNKDNRNDMQRREMAAYFDFFPVPNNIAGYVWDFPTQIKGEAMRCWGIYDTNMLAGEKRPQLKEHLVKEMSRLGFDLNDYEIK